MVAKFSCIILTLIILGCNPPTSPDIEVHVSQIVSLADGGRPDGNTNGTCAKVSRVIISESPASLSVGDSERIDVTPKDSQGQPRDPDCDIASGVSWDSNEDVCTIRDDKSFVTTVKGIAAGQCTIEACVENICDSESFNVS